MRDFHTGNDFGHTQNRDPDGVTRGEYHILLPDGRVQSVKYTADDQGFHADVSYDGAGAAESAKAAAAADASGGGATAAAVSDAAGAASSVVVMGSTSSAAAITAPTRVADV